MEYQTTHNCPQLLNNQDILCIPLNLRQMFIIIQFKSPIEYKELEAKHIKVFVIEVSNRQKKLPTGFLNPVSITSYKNIAKRDEIYDR